MSYSLTIVDGNNTNEWIEVHKAGCADLRKMGTHTKKSVDSETFEADDFADATMFLCGDYMSDGPSYDDCTDRYQTWEENFSEYRKAVSFSGCVKMTEGEIPPCPENLRDMYKWEPVIEPQYKVPGCICEACLYAVHEPCEGPVFAPKAPAKRYEAILKSGVVVTVESNLGLSESQVKSAVEGQFTGAKVVEVRNI